MRKYVNSSFMDCKLYCLPRRQRTSVQCAAARAEYHADVVVVGAGIIGISICHKLLKHTRGSLSVTLVEKEQPCSGATGAGQGYIWLAHRDIGSPAWDLAAWSKQLWQDCYLPDLSSAVEWQDSGSLLIANDVEQAEQLQQRQEALQAAGLQAELLGSRQLQEAEPALAVTSKWSGLLLGSDAQINGRLAATSLLQECHQFSDSFHFLHSEGVASLERTASGEVTGIRTDAGRRVQASCGVVLAAGAWIGHLLADVLAQEAWRAAFTPRKGHLLEVQAPPGMPEVVHGLMEVEYTKNYSGAQKAANEDAMAITFTATTSASGSLLIGSSREFSGFDKHRSDAAECAILQRASRFLPLLSSLKPEDSHTRVGLRPFAASGPVIGEMPGCPGLFVAGGHEGSGLTLAPATSELIARGILKYAAVPEFAFGFCPQPQPT